MERILLRSGQKGDCAAIYEIEKACFPEKEAASFESFANRLSAFPDEFLILEVGGKIVGFANGLLNDSDTVRDEFFTDTRCHNPNGRWKSIMGLAVLPEERGNGYARRIMEAVLDDAKKRGLGCTLTCKDNMRAFYEKFGFVCRGVSESVHGGAVWYDMKTESFQ